MTFSGDRATRRVRAAAVGLFAVAAGAAGAMQAFAQETPTCFGKTATIMGSGTITGTPDDDVIVGSAADDRIEGLGGDDRLCGMAGNDSLNSGLRDDKADGGEGNDFVRG